VKFDDLSEQDVAGAYTESVDWADNAYKALGNGR
jgi:hypothetical protein